MRSLFAITLATVLLAGCGNGGSSVDNPFWLSDSRGVWVAIEPTQCLTNPWEQDWLASHDNDYDSYPSGPKTPELNPEEAAIIRDYYARQGVDIIDIATACKYDVVCRACSCPQGHTLYLLVEGRDVETMTDLGYRREAPPFWA